MNQIPEIETNKPKPAIQSATIQSQIAQLVTTGALVIGLITGSPIGEDVVQSIIVAGTGIVMGVLSIWGIAGRLGARTMIRGWFK